jgi:predicted ArsR family transcriptional regulator
MTKHDITRTERFLKLNAGETWTAAQLARRIERSEPTVRLHLKRLVEDGRMSVKRSKRNQFVYRWIG